MNPQGYQKLTEALSAANIPAEVTPVPQPGEDVRYVDVRMNQTPGLGHVLNALGEAGLMAHNRPTDVRPALRLDFVSSELRAIAGSDPRPPLTAAARIITFEDLAYRQ